MSTKHNMKRLPLQKRRGSTVLLVLAMLSILLLLGIAFSYSTRLETQASYNYAELSQARSAASSGLPMALPMLVQASQGLTTNMQDWSVVPQALQKMAANGKSANIGPRDIAALNQAGIPVKKDKNGKIESGPQANVQVRDLSGLVNINAIKDESALERVVAAVLPGTDTKQKSAALMLLRGDTPAGSTRNSRADRTRSKAPSTDPRDPAASMIDNLTRLRAGLNSGRPLFSEPEIEKLSTFVTVFSQAPEVFNGPNGESIDKIPLDTIDPKVVYDTLRQAFPDKKNELLLQFAANVADFSDEDDEPTVLDSSGNRVNILADASGATASNYTIGVEKTAVISEVYPDSATSVGFGDDGQFVEIHNPWNESVNLHGWTLRMGTGASVSLTAQLPAGGYLVVTDNYDRPSPESPAGHGSLVSLFGNTADGASRQVMVQPGLDLADRNGRVSLYNPEGQLADIFSYDSTGQIDSKISFQRVDPLVRGYSTAQATPFGPSTGGLSNVETMAAATRAWQDGNSTMTKLSQLFAISTGFVEQNQEGTGVAGTDKVHASQLAELTFPENVNLRDASAEEPYPDNLDLRLIDVFTATPFYNGAEDGALANAEDPTDGRSALDAFQKKLERAQEREARSQQQQDDNEEAETTRTTVFSYGKLNVNTCSKYALLGLDMNTAANAGNRNNGYGALIEQFEGHRLRNTQSGQAPYRNISDFVTQFVPELSRSNLQELDSVTDQITVGSSAFEIVATNRLSDKEQAALDSKENSSGPRPATATARWVISMDQEPYSVVSFTLIP